ncbi:alkane 1-monooxygenase [Ketobacter alkanivorans]|uniref:Alkane 1-monooxygenase n=1 Tax=Ketobacter alkanivorans TaxID=1917421 RepID=A0A2K9LP72_9GAMM|nr:alkane 1-monooxygenase [Ketobacter alkanivorans]AUM13265.1 alkane 1-monooxygenase [Ketobacter alkanivorans]MCP5016813.1 alkane 1-monooxygenase [Ketobacter sp.]
MFESMSPDRMLALKKWGYLLFWATMVPLVPFAAMIGQDSGTQNYWAFFLYAVVFGIIPIADFVIGKDPSNPDEAVQVPAMSEERIYRVFTLLMAGIWLIVQGYAGYVFINNDYSIWGQLGWILSIGTVGGIIAINLGHELIHKDPKLENWAGGLMLASVTYAGFKVEHVRGHHVHVSTPEDASSSRYNQTLYHFLPRAFVRNFINAWKLEKQYLERKGHANISVHNELIWWYAISALFAVGYGVVWGWMGVVFFLGQSFVAALTLEVINYVEHYGLHRRENDKGRYERVTPAHSWNSNYLLTNVALFQLQRHSDHHAYAKRRYQVLRHYEESPQLPAGYASMYVLAWFPPLWKKIMNPRVEAYYQGEMDQLFRERGRVNNIIQPAR